MNRSRNESRTLLNRRSKIRKRLLRWYANNGRSFPWRGIKSPYRILVSEVMLQQTQASRVIEKFPGFVRQFPTFASLASASAAEVVHAWRGMGYNNRAIRLQRLARAVISDHRGKLPSQTEALQKLPGIGRYSAHAIACFAFRQPMPVVDTNVRRVLGRVFRDRATTLGEWELATWALPKQHAYDWNQALMDFGATICTARNAKCHSCPVSALCPSAHNADRIPTRKGSNERLVDGIPNRIYRGRVIEVLRNAPSRSFLFARTIGRTVRPGFTLAHCDWLHTILLGLERDGLVTLCQRGKDILASLPQ